MSYGTVEAHTISGNNIVVRAWRDVEKDRGYQRVSFDDITIEFNGKIIDFDDLTERNKEIALDALRGA